MEFIQMNKALLLAGAACVLCLSTPAKAQQMFGHEIEPYIGADYIFTSADFKKAGNLLKEDYNGRCRQHWYPSGQICRFGSLLSDDR